LKADMADMAAGSGLAAAGAGLVGHRIPADTTGIERKKCA
jgi:hypothetical protein